MSRRRQHVPFDGDPPAVGPGDTVECRTASGGWTRMAAASAPRYDDANACGWVSYLTVAVGPWDDRIVNWPAEDVRPA